MEQGAFNFEQRLSIQESFEAFHPANPELYAFLVATCFELRRLGFRRYGVKSLWERARWHFQVEKGLGEDFKLNNNYHSRYARLIMENYPELEGFFEVRELRSNDEKSANNK